MSLSRRRFLQSAVALGAGTAVAVPAAHASDPIVRNGQSHIRLSIAGYSYRDYFAGKLKPAMTLEDYVDLAASMGLDAVEPTAYYFKDTSPEYLAKLKGRCTRLGLDVSGGAVGNNFCKPSPAELKEEIRKVNEWVERYAILGAKTVRIFAGPLAKGDVEDKARERCAAAIEEACEHAAKYGIYLALENHGGIVATAEQMLALIKLVRHDWFGVNWDTGNFHTADPYADLAKIAPYAVTVQIKTEIQPAGQPKGPSDLAKLINILRAANYRGYVALEYEAAEDPRTAIPGHIETLKKLMG